MANGKDSQKECLGKTVNINVLLVSNKMLIKTWQT